MICHRVESRWRTMKCRPINSVPDQQPTSARTHVTNNHEFRYHITVMPSNYIHIPAVSVEIVRTRWKHVTLCHHNTLYIYYTICMCRQPFPPSTLVFVVYTREWRVVEKICIYLKEVAHPNLFRWKSTAKFFVSFFRFGCCDRCRCRCCCCCCSLLALVSHWC